jgi:hypothetical protein
VSNVEGMRVVIEDLHSPIARIARLVPASLELIAPERAPDLAPHVGRLTLHIVATREMICEFDPDSGDIAISALFLEVVWALTYGYHLFHVKVLNRPHWRGQEVNLRVDAEVSAAMDLVAWAIRASTSGEPWPTSAPSPSPNPQSNTFEYGAQQLALGATGVILHHELAHKYLQHRVSTLATESAADFAAVDWVLHQDTCPPEQFGFRAMCVAIAFLLLAARSIHTGEYDGVTHPITFLRLVHSLRRHLTPEDHLVWGFVGAILSLHMQAMEIPLPTGEYGAFSDFVDACVEQLAREALVV